MEFWKEQLVLAQQQVAEIEDKIAQQRHKVEELRDQGLDASLTLRLVTVMEDSLVRAKAHAAYVEGRIAAHKDDPDRERRRKAWRSLLPSKAGTA